MSCSRLLFSSRDDVIGKVCITRDMLAEHPKGKVMSDQQGPISHPCDEQDPRVPSMIPHEGPCFPQDTVAG